MPQNISLDIGGGVIATIQVPSGPDSYDIPRDMAKLATDALAAIAAKPSGAPAAGPAYSPNYLYSGKIETETKVGTTYARVGLSDLVATINGVGIFLWYANCDPPTTAGAIMKTKIVREAWAGGGEDPTAYKTTPIGGGAGRWYANGMYMLKIEQGRAYSLQFQSSVANLSITTRYWKLLELPMSAVAGFFLNDDVGLSNQEIP